MESTPARLDDVDQRILAELTRDARQSVTALAQRVHVSRAHAYARINRLQEDGVITRYSAVVEPVRAGLRSSAYVTLKLRQHGWREMRDALSAIPEVHHVSLVGGNFDVIMLVRARDNLDLRRVVFDQIQSMPGVIDTQTFLIFEDVDAR
ncbi:Lrp/AsnC family transcriptional regulator [Citricoccus nitrophenolicus]|uniref:Lrp/AsnC family transcriptional regulator n=1 Tax=Citricoccus nitrophenolicus TaxID=863575 RepID=UPI0031EB6A34